jgi:hypothetical protein
VASTEISLSTYPLLVLAGKKNFVLNAVTGEVFPFDVLPGQPATLSAGQVATSTGLAFARVERETSIVLLDLKPNAQLRRVVGGLDGIADLFFDKAKGELVVRSAPSSHWKDILSLHLAAPAPIEDPNARRRPALPGDELTKLPTEVKEIRVTWPGEQVRETCVEFVPGSAPTATSQTASLEALAGATRCSDKWQKARTRSLQWKQVAKSAATSPIGAASYFFNALLRQSGDELFDVIDLSRWVGLIDPGELLTAMAGPALDMAAADDTAPKSPLSEAPVRQLLLNEIGPASLAFRYRLITSVIDTDKPPTPTLRDQHANDFWADWQLKGFDLQAHFRRSAGTPALGWVVVHSEWRDATGGIHPVFESAKSSQFE